MVECGIRVFSHIYGSKPIQRSVLKILSIQENKTNVPYRCHYRSIFNFQVTKYCFRFNVLAAVPMKSYIF
jgi:hypothetical protein